MLPSAASTGSMRPTSPVSPSTMSEKLGLNATPPPASFDQNSKPALTPPTSEEWNKGDASDLSDLELDDDDDDSPIEPDHYYEGGHIPVFKPTMDQFRSFKRFIAKIDSYGMKSGIVKVIPPKEWIDSLPPLDERVKTIKVKNPITQEFSGVHGTYTQANIEKQRSYNLPQWKALTEESQHQPPARRGERRKNTDKPARAPTGRTRATPSSDATASKRKPGRPRKNPLPESPAAAQAEDKIVEEAEATYNPPTPTSPTEDVKEAAPVAKAPKTPRARSSAKGSGSNTGGRQPKSVSERRKYNRRDAPEQIDEAAFQDFDYRIHNQAEYTPERCNELETLYWKSLTFAPPMYGADMPGSLFDESTTSWNVAKLENLLDILGQNVPGVNTAYLYLGMWKATFAWHLEDVDLYSINYIHFGAPKQWYSISQEDARRFEAAMKSIWPNDAKNCSQFLRHKTYLISPALLQSQFNIKVNKLVHHEGEFVITYPYGYHSGYNLGYNCAESVNFATEGWLEYGRIAKKCDCEADSVWIDVEDIERKLRGEATPEYFEETDDEEDVEEAEEEETHHLPSPPASVKSKPKAPRKRKRDSVAVAAAPESKKIKLRIKTSSIEPCILCPNNTPHEDLLSTDNGKYAHRICASYMPETYLDDETGQDVACNVAEIDKARLDLKCSFCRSKKGACFQCSSKKCTRAYHATCAAAAGVQVEYGFTPYYGEDGTEYIGEAYDFRCRFHRPKRTKNITIEALENNHLVLETAKVLKAKDVVQIQYLGGEIFAGLVLENRSAERTVLVEVQPEGDRIEVEWKWILALDPATSQLVKPSANAKPLPSHISMNTVQTKQTASLGFGPPLAGDAFNDTAAQQKWGEYIVGAAPKNSDQVRLDLSKENQVWYYLGKGSTEARAQFTEDLAKPRFNPAGNFLDMVRPPPPVVSVAPRKSLAATYPSGVNYHALNGAMAVSRQQSQPGFQQSSQSTHVFEPINFLSQRTFGGQNWKNPPLRKLSQAGPVVSSHTDNKLSNATEASRGSTYQVNKTEPPAETPSQHAINGFSHHTFPAPMSSRYSYPASGRFQQQSAPPKLPYTSPYEPIYTPSTGACAQMTALPATPGIPTAPMQDRPALSDGLSRLAHYNFLRNALCRRPQTYKSPYGPAGEHGLETSQERCNSAPVKGEPRQWTFEYGLHSAMQPATPLRYMGPSGAQETGFVGGSRHDVADAALMQPPACLGVDQLQTRPSVGQQPVRLT